jgi:hypothetical protein
MLWMYHAQYDLFAEEPPEPGQAAAVLVEAPPPDFVARIRAELETTLHRVRTSTSLPWPDLTRATLAELRFHSISGWLPDGEAAALRDAFTAEMARLYERDGEIASTP